MAFSTLAQSSLPTAIGYQCYLSATNHPDAANYQGRACSIVAVNLMPSGKALLTVQFADGMQIKGLFFSELEDETGHPLQRRKFERLPVNFRAIWHLFFRAIWHSHQLLWL